MNGEFIAEFAGIAEAGRMTGVNTNSIIKVCKGKGKSARGYIWRYKNATEG